MDASDFHLGRTIKIRRDEDYGPDPWPAEPTGEVRVHPHAADGEVSVPTQTAFGWRRPAREAIGDGGSFSEIEWPCVGRTYAASGPMTADKQPTGG